MKTLYEQNPANWDKLRAAGRGNLAEMARHFTVGADMDRALGTQNAACHWLAGRNSANAKTDHMAALWLKANAKPAAPPVATPQGAMLIVVAPSGQVDKVRRLLAVMGCEVEDL
jgi:hypothetical protein